MRIDTLKSVEVSGSFFAYQNIIKLTPDQYQSGVLAHDHRMAQPLANVRGISEADDERMSLIGAISEIPLFLVYPLDPYDPYIGAGPDFTYRKWVGDIKASHDYPNLLVNQRLWKEDWLYVHALQVEKDQFQLCGWLYGLEVPLVADKVLTQYGRPAAWRVPLRRLRPFRALIGPQL